MRRPVRTRWTEREFVPKLRATRLASRHGTSLGFGVIDLGAQRPKPIAMRAPSSQQISARAPGAGCVRRSRSRTRREAPLALFARPQPGLTARASAS